MLFVKRRSRKKSAKESAVHIEHGGERLTISVEESRRGAVTLGFAGPTTFRVTRPDYVVTGTEK